MGIVTFSGLHSRLGFLPVIPGPCGLFRASAVTHDILHEVREFLVVGVGIAISSSFFDPRSFAAQSSVCDAQQLRRHHQPELQDG